MKKTTFLMSLLLMLVFILISAIAIAAESVAPVVNQTWFEWVDINAVVLLGAALAISEVLALIPGFKGNGILDTIIKFIKLLISKKETTKSQ